MIQWLKDFSCRIGWHCAKWEYLFSDGCSAHARCTNCKFEGMIDSQGNLF